MKSYSTIFDRDSLKLAIGIVQDVSMINISNHILGEEKKYPDQLTSDIMKLKATAEIKAPEIANLSLDEFYNQIIQPVVASLTKP